MELSQAQKDALNSAQQKVLKAQSEYNTAFQKLFALKKERTDLINAKDCFDINEQTNQIQVWTGCNVTSAELASFVNKYSIIVASIKAYEASINTLRDAVKKATTEYLVLLDQYGVKTQIAQGNQLLQKAKNNAAIIIVATVIVALIVYFFSRK